MSEESPPVLVQGQPPQQRPPRVEDFDDLDKKSIESLVDYMKYVATASGITMGFYAKGVQDNVTATQNDLGKLIAFSPVIFWFFSILFSVIGVFPRTYKAKNDYQKEAIILKVRALKSRYSIASITFFLLGFLAFVYVAAGALWKFYPFT